MRVYLDWGQYMLGALDVVFSSAGMLFGFVTMKDPVWGLIFGIIGYVGVKIIQAIVGYIMTTKIPTRQYHSEFSSRLDPVKVRTHNALMDKKDKLEAV
ncbi:hypothetical protein HQ529_03575 [Candidatus Woesearchaeota archaeon]|nr:hypothetical protein [Candidatus Woesearchaeota archaeon]